MPIPKYVVDIIIHGLDYYGGLSKDFPKCLSDYITAEKGNEI
jgi:hypothetical protein